MNFIKRATTSIVRKPGKMAILLALVFVLGNVIAGSISVEQSVRNTESAVLGGITPVATLEVDWQAIEEKHSFGDIDWGDAEAIAERDRIMSEYTLTAERIEMLGALPSVEFFDYSNRAVLASWDMQRYYPEEALSMGFAPPSGDWAEHFTLHGSQTGDVLDLRMGLIEIVDGRTLNAQEIEQGENAVLVSRNFADLNHLYIGAIFVLEHEVFEDDMVYRASYNMEVELPDIDIEMPSVRPPDRTRTIEFEFTVVGIYEPVVASGFQIQAGDWQAIAFAMEQHNKIYTSNRAVGIISELISISEALTPFFVFRNAEGLDTFTRDTVALLGDYYRVMNNMRGISDVVAPMRNMSRLANIILYVGIGASLIILSLLVTLFLKDRRKEIGIYLALGERKTKIVGQILAEVLIVSILGIALSLFSGNLLAGQLSNSMIEDAVIAQQEEPGDDSWSWEPDPLAEAGFRVEITLEDLQEQYNVSLGAEIVLFFFLAGLLTVLLSTLIPILYVLKLNPRKILM
ncbi:MAG: ABC transporter permease [Oscillospiraceae bacterium]|nr:ABC transporter permease [Oscillospiraceae bacterium]